MKLFIACDHAAFKEKSELISYLKNNFPKIEIEDLGANSEESVHYPSYAQDVCTKLLKTPGSRGILLCGTGIGMCIVANKFRGIRASLVHTVEEAKLTREHNDSNVLCLGSRTISLPTICEATKAWLTTDFAGGRHQARLDLFKNLGEPL